MIFKVVEHKQSIGPESEAFVGLTWDDWNDYSYFTLFQAFYYNGGKTIELGGVRIAFCGQKTRERVFSIGDSFSHLDEYFSSFGKKYFSLGNEQYYIKLNELGEEIRDTLLFGLNDIAKYPRIFEYAIEEDVTRISLLRFASVETVIGQFRRLASGGVRLTSYHFNYSPPSRSASADYELNFLVVPESFPPTNIHVLIGRNGVGKTTLLNNMINSLTDPDSNGSGSFDYTFDMHNGQFFANVISISFSAFDETAESIQANRRKDKGLTYSYIGLKMRNPDNLDEYNPMKVDDLCKEFTNSLIFIKINNRITRWNNCIQTLENDPNFQESSITKLMNLEGEELKIEASRKFKLLSSGHKIVLLTITRLVALLEEKSLVLIDEPESHLHPPLLSSFTRALSELLILSNGVAIIATHSPVVLQEVPKSCVWKLRRSGDETIAERLNIESFGENVGILTSEVFGLEARKSGFYSMIESVYSEKRKFDDVMSHFGNQLGAEAKALLRVMEIEDHGYDEN